MSLLKLREIMARKGFTSERLAEASSVPKSTIDKIAAGFNPNPGVKTIRALANALGLSLEEMDELLDLGTPAPDSIKAMTPEETKLLIRFRRLTPKARAAIMQTIDLLINDTSES